jgi:hypothetical protein
MQRSFAHPAPQLGPAHGRRLTTTIYSNDKFVFINRTIKANGTTQETFVPIMHGSELERLIAALQAAQNMHG